MKKQIILFTIGMMGLLIFVACGNDSSTTTTSNGENMAGVTGIPEIDNLTKEIEKDPRNAELLVARAKQFYNQENYDYAIDDMQLAMRIDSVNAEYHHVLSDIYLEYYKSRLALKTMKRCVNLHPEDVPSLLKLARIQQILQQYDMAVGTIGRVAKLEPNNPDVFFSLGLNHSLSGNKEMAIKTLKQATSIDPDVLKKIIGIDRNNVDAYQRMGVIYIEKDSLQKAYDNFNISIKVDPAFINGHFYRGYASELMGKLEEAREDYRAVVRMITQNQDGQARKAQESLNAKAKEGLSRIAKAINQ